MDAYTEKFYACIHELFTDYCLCKKCGVYPSGILDYYPQSVSFAFHRCSSLNKTTYPINFAVEEWMKIHTVYYTEYLTPREIVSSTSVALMRTLKKYVKEDDLHIFVRIAFLFKWKMSSAYDHILKYIPMLIELAKVCSNVPLSEFATIVRNCCVSGTKVTDNAFLRIQEWTIRAHNNNACKLWHSWDMESHEYTHFNQWLPRELVEDTAMLMGYKCAPLI